MRINAKVTDLTLEQWDHVQESVRANGYEFQEGQTRVCAVFELAPQTERHVEMPLMIFSALIKRLAHRGHGSARERFTEIEAGGPMPTGVQGGSWLRKELGI